MSLDNFKKFVKENPKLVNFVRNGDMTWQKFYELYDLYGPFHDIWNKYLGITTNGVFSFKDMFNVFKSNPSQFNDILELAIFTLFKFG